ncbi:MAG TPA: exodeoxyribonuclease VII large subunit [Candidatus Acidoferrales bacterium]|jgi:exodeoxyribonuclease VII large subunit|nr:exodeoxyribonuclease VII large subunit [Candidatus Acidoferrales bacterium]
MSKPAKSQWDFGELFSPEETRKVLTVSELTGKVRVLLEKSIGSIWVSGEITNLRAQSSGHMYFSLKDAGAQLSCVLFSREKVSQREFLADGKKVLLQGEVTVYEARGQYQLIVRAVELQGVGALQIAFEKLKQRLAAEGLFAPERKRPLPRFPQRIGLVTSPTGAAIRDVLHVIQRRNPALEIILAPARVQGDGAAEEIAEAIQTLNEFNSSPVTHHPSLDLILITRGGGSLEDLWAFNEEPVARAIFESTLPVVSAVGHEIDFTIADFVADFRAATPSAAAEIITEGVFASREFVAEAPALLQRAARRGLESATDNFTQLGARLSRLHPRRRLDESLQQLDDLQSGLLRGLKSTVRSRSLILENLAGRFSRAKPSQALKSRREALRQLERRLNVLGPEQVLARGYSITTDATTGKVLRDAAKVKPGQKLKTRLAKGEVRSRAEAAD